MGSASRAMLQNPDKGRRIALVGAAVVEVPVGPNSWDQLAPTSNALFVKISEGSRPVISKNIISALYVFSRAGRYGKLISLMLIKAWLKHP